VKKIKKFLLMFDRTSLYVSLNDTLYLQLKGLSRNPLLRVITGFMVLKEEYFIGTGREHWLPATEEELSGVDSVSKGYTQGIACIVAVK
jgi:hypothetical protein